MASPKKISLFIYSLTGGGAERMILNIANGLAERGYEIDLVLVFAEGPYISDVSNNVNIHEIGGTNAMNILPRLIKYLYNSQPSCLLATNEIMNILAVLACSSPIVRTKPIIRVSSVNSVRERESLKKKIIPTLQKKLYEHTREIVAISEGVKKDILQNSNVSSNKISVIYNPVFNESILELAKDSPNHDWFRDSEPVILGAGRLEPEKDFSTLIRAFSIIQNNTSARLIIIGEGGERERLQQLAKSKGVEEYVSLPGFIQNPYSYMRAADLFVLSSKAEGFGNVLVESMAVGTPVISTDCPGGPVEILSEGRYGELVTVGDYQEMAEAILKNLQEPGQNSELQQRAEDFSLESSLDRYEEVLTR